MGKTNKRIQILFFPDFHWKCSNLTTFIWLSYLKIREVKGNLRIEGVTKQMNVWTIKHQTDSYTRMRVYNKGHHSVELNSYAPWQSLICLHNRWLFVNFISQSYEIWEGKFIRKENYLWVASRYPYRVQAMLYLIHVGIRCKTSIVSQMMNFKHIFVLYVP